MGNSKEIKTIKVNGKDISFIEGVTPKGVTYSTTTFIQYKIPSNYEEAFEYVGGYTRDVLYNKMKDLDVNEITMISTVTENGLNVAYFLYEKDGNIVESVASLEEVFLPHAIDFIVGSESVIGKVELKNSLSFVGDAKYGKYMVNYEEPTSVNHSGVKIGEEDVLFGETFTIKGLTKITHMLDGQFLKIVEEVGIDALRVNVWDKVGAFDTVSSEYFLKEDGDIYTIFDDLRISMNKEKPMTDEEIFESEVQDELEGVHKRIKQHMEKLSTQNLTEKELEEGLESFKKRIDYTGREERIRESLGKDLYEPYTLLFSRSGINTLLRSPLITVERG